MNCGPSKPLGKEVRESVSTAVAVAFCCHGKTDQRQLMRAIHLAHTQVKAVPEESQGRK